MIRDDKVATVPTVSNLLANFYTTVFLPIGKLGKVLHSRRYSTEPAQECLHDSNSQDINKLE